MAVATLVSVLAALLHLVLLVAIAPAVLGFTQKIRARLVGFPGPPVGAPYRELFRLLRKQTVGVENPSYLFLTAPLTAFSATITLATLIPSFTRGMATAPLADLLAIFGLFLLAEAGLIVTALNSGAIAVGVNPSRLFINLALSMPAIFLLLLVFAFLTGSTNLDLIAGFVGNGGVGVWPRLVMAAAAMVCISIAWNFEFSAGSTSALEAASPWEAMWREYSAVSLALIKFTLICLRTLWLTLLGTVFMPFWLAESQAGLVSWLKGIAGWGVRLFIFAIALGTLEAYFTGLRSDRVRKLLVFGVIVAFLACFVAFVGEATE